MSELLADSDHETALSGRDRMELRTWLRLLTCYHLVESEIRGGLRQKFDITLARFDVLAKLERAPDGLSMGELSRRLMVSNGNVTGLVDRLAQEGLIETTRPDHDRRAQIVRLTEAGRTTFDAMLPTHHGWVSTLFSGLEPDEIKTLHSLLGRLKASAQKGREGRNG
jgi:DNA-binding MarR family transcriptional regulator